MSGKFDTVSIARRMSWAANRQTTRVEDRAYSLMGIFDVNMPLLYGEGKKSFTRLQESIMRVSDDQSLFAWGLPPKIRTMQEYLENFPTKETVTMRGPFADSPSEFTCSDRIYVLQDPQSTVPPIVSSNGIRMELQVKRPPNTTVHFAVIYCTLKDSYKLYLGFPIKSWGGRWVARCGEMVAIPVADLVPPGSGVPYREPSVLFVKEPLALPKAPQPANILRLVQTANEYKDHYLLKDVHCSAHATYCWNDQALTLSKDQDALHAVFYFAPAKPDPIALFPEADYQRLKLRKGTNLDAMRMKNSFLTTATGHTNRDGISTRDTYSILYPPFAILIGGMQARPWLKIMLILDDGDPDADFRRLFAANKQLVRSCTTKKHLLSLLDDNAATKPLSGRQNLYESQLIMHWRYSYMFRVTSQVPGWEYEADGKSLKTRTLTRHTLSEGDQSLSVDAEFRMVWSNLVESSLVLFVDLKRVGDNVRATVGRPKWWQFSDDD